MWPLPCTNDGGARTVDVPISFPSPSVADSRDASTSGNRNDSLEAQQIDNAAEVELEGETMGERLVKVEQQWVESTNHIAQDQPWDVIKPSSRLGWEDEVNYVYYWFIYHYYRIICVFGFIGLTNKVIGQIFKSQVFLEITEK